MSAWTVRAQLLDWGADGAASTRPSGELSIGVVRHYLRHPYVGGMTLIAGVAHDEGSTLVSDTKLSFRKNSIESSRTFKNAMNKIALLNDDLAVAIAGEDAPLIQERLFQLNDKSVLAVADHLRTESGGGFLIAQHGAGSILVIADGKIERVEAGEVALEGSSEAFATYRTLYRSGEKVFHPRENLQAAMDSMVFGPYRHPDVGGFVLSVHDTDVGFRYRGGHARIAPDGVATRDGWVLPAGRSDWQDIIVLGGGSGTPRALGIYIVQAQVGRLFPQEEPYAPMNVAAQSVASFVDAAAERGQILVAPPTLPNLPLRS